MDRPRRRSGLLIVLAALAGGFATNPPLRALRWLAPGADGARILTQRPVECLAIPAGADAAYQVEVGRAAFRTPLLLGGQAARAGIDCETCHRGARTNRDFDFPGLSGAPGTADVTTSLMSSHRGDGIDNPKPIPDLGGPKDKFKISQAPDSPDLDRFIHGIVTQEFDGAEPPPAVLQGLAAYVRALSPGACPPTASEAVRVGADVADARRAVRAALAGAFVGSPGSGDRGGDGRGRPLGAGSHGRTLCADCSRRRCQRLARCRPRSRRGHLRYHPPRRSGGSRRIWKPG